MSIRPMTGAHHRPDATRDNYAPRDSDTFLLLLPNPDFSHTRRDIFLMIRVALLVFVAGLGVVTTFLALLFFGAN